MHMRKLQVTKNKASNGKKGRNKKTRNKLLNGEIHDRSNFDFGAQGEVGWP